MTLVILYVHDLKYNTLYIAMNKSMLGALVGDAAGATLEFYHKPITEEIALNAMQMPGGGRMRVGPGQITDDGELTLALWQALMRTREGSVPVLEMMRAYKDWYDSCPFDMGRTCGLAFEVICDYFNGRHIGSFEECFQTINDVNAGSEANGCLMRASAIPAWMMERCNAISVQGAVECAREDAKLSHPSIVCQEVNMIYVFAICHLLLGDKPEDVVNTTDTFVKNTITSDKVLNWYFTESLDISNLDATKQIGHVRWGFVMAIHFLRNPEITYEDAIKITLMKGGDTDTNAAIVGGMVGAYQGIPNYMLTPVMEFDCTTDRFRGHRRPQRYSVKRVLSGLNNQV